MTDQTPALEPTLTADDKAILRALPDVHDLEAQAVDIWEIGRRLNRTDLREVRQVLDGLDRFGYVARFSFRVSTGRADGWLRTQRAQDLLNPPAAPQPDQTLLALDATDPTETTP